MARDRVIGVSYDGQQPAPTVVLKGSGEQVDEVLASARANAVPVVRNAALAEQLYRVPIDAPIGRELFPVMALLLVQVLDLDQMNCPKECS